MRLLGRLIVSLQDQNKSHESYFSLFLSLLKSLVILFRDILVSKVSNLSRIKSISKSFNLFLRRKRDAIPPRTATNKESVSESFHEAKVSLIFYFESRIKSNKESLIL
jgi:hypothetical protein